MQALKDLSYAPTDMSSDVFLGKTFVLVQSDTFLLIRREVFEDRGL